MMEGGGETRSYVLLNIMLLCITIFNDNGLLLITSWIKYLQHFDHILEITMTETTFTNYSDSPRIVIGEKGTPTVQFGVTESQSEVM